MATTVSTSRMTAYGTFTGTGSVITLQLGFDPCFFMAWNYTDGDIVHIWAPHMTADTSVDITTAVASNANNAVTAYTGTVGANAVGLTLGTDISENGKVYGFIALGK